LAEPAPVTPLTRFDRDTAVEPLGDGAFAARIDRAWWIGRGAHGGYIAAIVLRAMTETVADPQRQARSLTIHYTAPPAEGPARVAVTVERTGRSMTTVTARMTQDDRLVVLALAAFSLPYRPAAEYADAAPPDAPPPEDARQLPFSSPAPDFASNLDMRPAFGPRPFSASEREAVTGGWLRLAEPHAHDPIALAFYADAWWPAPFGRLTGFAPAPTIDLTVHFRAPASASSAPPGDYLLSIFRSRTARDGFFEEDGELWTRDGILLAQSRQLALLLG
jgi:acyl-CoA thioesterase